MKLSDLGLVTLALSVYHKADTTRLVQLFQSIAPTPAATNTLYLVVMHPEGDEPISYTVSARDEDEAGEKACEQYQRDSYDYTSELYVDHVKPVETLLSEVVK